LRRAFFLVLLATAPCLAQDLPDPGRRLSPEEQNADPEKRSAEKPHTAEPRYGGRAKDAKACENARIHYQLSCGRAGSPREYGRGCAEAYAIYRQSCP
jgi:hypothetical protein